MPENGPEITLWETKDVRSERKKTKEGEFIHRLLVLNLDCLLFCLFTSPVGVMLRNLVPLSIGKVILG